MVGSSQWPRCFFLDGLFVLADAAGLSMSELPRLTLKCPHCGAPLPSVSLAESSTCAFCGMTSVPADVSASAPAPSGHAGDVLVASQTIEADKLSCPRCSLPLFGAEAASVPMLGCGGCGGIWLDNESAQHAVKTLDSTMAQLADMAAANAIQMVSDAPSVACPVCRNLMLRTQAPQAGIWIDVCAAHGTWFDRFELGIVMEALRPRNEFKPVSYNGPTPDFREGANTELQGFGKIVGMGVLGLLGGAAALGKVGGAR